MQTGLEQETFTSFKSRFYSRISDLSAFDCADFNLLKVVLDGLKVNYVARGIKRETIFEHQPGRSISLAAQRAKHFRKIRAARRECQRILDSLHRPYLFFDNGRIAESNDRKVSFYFHKIEQFLGSGQSFTIYQTRTDLKNGVEVGILEPATRYNDYQIDDARMIASLKSSYNKIEQLNVFDDTELHNIRIAINKFFDEYRFWTFLLKNAGVRFVLFDEHYHREGFLLALKRKGIKAVELQHGLIAPEDIFYVFPENVKTIAFKSLFPDIIFTYGQYWSKVLLKGAEFNPRQVHELGVYQELNTYVSEEKRKELSDFMQGCSMMLVTTQTFLHENFSSYIKWLSGDLFKKRSDIKIVVKNHPSEKPENYAGLVGLENVKLSRINTEYLLSVCQWHISCYSTTLYDATKYSCRNFSLYIEQCRDYIRTFETEGISTIIQPEQNPIEVKEEHKNNTRRIVSDIYEDFEKHKHKLKQLDYLLQ
jgi:hypothetical protein